MVMFWSLVVVMLIVSLLVIVRHLVKNRQVVPIITDKPALAIFKERLLELEQEKQDGLLTDEQLQSVKLEMEQSLLDEVNVTANELKNDDYQISPDWTAAGLIIFLVPVVAIGLYYQLGEPKIIDALQLSSAHNSATTRQEQLASVEDLVDTLAARMQQNPNDKEGWTMLARSYKALGRHAEAVTAYEHLYSLTGDDTDVLLQYADVIATANGGKLSGKPAELIHKALELSPDNNMGLWLAGMAAREQGDNEAALDYWQRLLPQVQNDAESYQQVRQLIHTARQELGIAEAEIDLPVEAVPQFEIDNNKSIRVNVSLAADLKDRTNPEDVLFIFAKATVGPPMPLAAARIQVKDLPLEIVLDDSMAMMPSLKLSSYDTVQVNARISRSGNPTESSGDLIAEFVVANPGQVELVELIIETVVP